METPNKLPKLLQSSANPNNLSATFQGILLGIIPLIIYIGQQRGIELTYNELIVLVEFLMGAISAVVILYGAIRKLKVKILG